MTDRTTPAPVTAGAHDNPLGATALQTLCELLEPLGESQLLWLSGYISGYTRARRQGDDPAGAPGAADRSEQPGAGTPQLTILYGTETGNSLRAAQIAAEEAGNRGFAVQLQDLREVRRAGLQQLGVLLLVVSTHGEGEPPDSAREFCKLLHGKRAPALNQVRFSVLALGDSSYEKFCQTGRDLDQRLEALGATRIHERVECDLEFTQPARTWAAAALSRLGGAAGRVEVADTAAPVAIGSPSGFGPDNPYRAEVLENIRLSGAGSRKQVHHLELALDDGQIRYEPGDALWVLPENPPESVAELLEALRASGEELVHTSAGELPLAQALGNRLEITRVTRGFLSRYARLAQSESLNGLLREDAARQFLGYANGRHVVDVVREFPLRGLPLDDLIATLRPLTARAYSIASSLRATPGEAHLTVGVAKYQARGAEWQGVASGWLARRDHESHTVPVYVAPNHRFRLPEDPSVPIIMVGPGTGVAPFRAFMAERRAVGGSGKNWLVFGDQHLRTDFLYQQEWLDLRREGSLQRLDVAWSRDGANKVYVQDRLRENGRAVYDWLEQGAHVYVCGDGKRMAPDVHAALLDVVADAGGRSRAAAQDYLERLDREQRYQRDVY